MKFHDVDDAVHDAGDVDESVGAVDEAVGIVEARRGGDVAACGVAVGEVAPAKKGFEFTALGGVWASAFGFPGLGWSRLGNRYR